MLPRVIAVSATFSGFGLAYLPPFLGPGTDFEYLSTFDDLWAFPALPLKWVGPYNGLEFQLRLVRTGVNGAVALGVVPESSPNIAAYDITHPGRMMTTQYDGSVTDTLNFKSFYADCVLNIQETLASVATMCTRKVKGYRATELIARQEFEYLKSGSIESKASMEKFPLDDDFKNVDTVIFESDYLYSELLSATLLDNMEYTVHFPLKKTEKTSE